MDKTLIVLLGPTGVGKTDIAIELAVHYRCDIISADSRQIYREMKIGTAVPDDRQMALVKHHFIRSASVRDYYSSNIFERDVMKLLPMLFSDSDIVIMAGGSGLYIDAVCEGSDDIPDTDPAVREKYNALYKNEGISGLRIALKVLDPEHYAKVDLKNHKRIIRALEICESTGRPYSSFLTRKKRERDFRVIRIGLGRKREELYQRINRRVDEMISAGLETEAYGLLEHRDTNALNSVGYREFFQYFDGIVTREKAIELIKRNSRRYAKRQMTWWVRDTRIKWFSPDEREEIISYIDDHLKSR
jgi:tRNA dimethylallyltransferase